MSSEEKRSSEKDKNEKSWLQLWGHSWERLTQKQKELVIEILQKLRKR